MATVVRVYFIVNWHDSIQISLEVSLNLKPLVYLRKFYKRFVWKWKT